LILVHTHIGYGSPHKQDNFSSHGSPLGEEELQATKTALGWPTMDKFYLPPDAVDYFRQALPGRAVETSGSQSSRLTARTFPKKPPSSTMLVSGALPDNWAADLPQWKPGDKPIATRAAGGAALNALAKHIPNIIGGSADLNPSTDTALKRSGATSRIRKRTVRERWARSAACGATPGVTSRLEFANTPWERQ
jgi:transketolase